MKRLPALYDFSWASRGTGSRPGTFVAVHEQLAVLPPRVRATACRAAPALFGELLQLRPGHGAPGLRPRLDRPFAERLRSSETIRSGAKVSTSPKPLQAGQTPSGLLNEKSAGSGCMAGSPQCEHSQRSLRRAGSAPPTISSRRPSPRRNACSQRLDEPRGLVRVPAEAVHHDEHRLRALLQLRRGSSGSLPVQPDARVANLP